jgi:ferredoxin
MTVYTVTVEPQGRTFRCPDTKSILVGVEHNGGADTIQVGCRSGGCGVCRIEVLEGTYTAKRMSKAFCTDDDVAHGILLSCRTYPTSDLVVRPCPKTTTSPASTNSTDH